MIDARWLVSATGCRLQDAERFAPHIDEACFKWGIVTEEQVAAFVANAARESWMFTRTEENLSYRTPERLVEVFSIFRMPSEGETLMDPLPDGKRNPLLYVNRPMELADLVYANRLGNGPQGSGDGWKYRGRGLFQLTGKSNYAAYEAATGVPATERPDMLSEPRYAADSAGWFWDKIGGNDLLAISFRLLVRRITGSRMDIENRLALFSRALQA
jgi:putative chitinase